MHIHRHTCAHTYTHVLSRALHPCFLPGIKLRVYAFVDHCIGLRCLFIGTRGFAGFWALESKCVVVLSSLRAAPAVGRGAGICDG